MKNRSNYTKLFLAGLGLATSFFVGAGAYAANDPSITINDSTDNLYTTGANTENTVVYDSNANVLKLKNFHGDRVVVSNIDSITIELEGENTLSMASYGVAGSDAKAIYAPNTDLTLAGDGKLTVVDQTPNDFKINASDVVVVKNFTLDGATLDLAFNTGACIGSDNAWGTKINITVNSGSMKLSKCLNGIETVDAFTVNGGTVEFGDDIAYPTSTYGSLTKNLKVTGGLLKVTGSSSGAIHVSNSVEISGGKVEIDMKGFATPIQIEKDSANNGSSSKRYFLISGGDLIINSEQCGITVEDADAESFIKFAGGTTTINNPNKSCKSVKITYGAENNPNIIIDKKMNLSPSDLLVKMEHNDTFGTYTYYLDSETDKMQNFVITEKIPDDPADPSDDKKDEDDVVVPSTSGKKAPNTGSNTNNQNYAIAAAIILPVLIGAGVGVAYYIRSRKTIKFDN